MTGESRKDAIRNPAPRFERQWRLGDGIWARLRVGAPRLHLSVCADSPKVLDGEGVVGWRRSPQEESFEIQREPSHVVRLGHVAICDMTRCRVPIQESHDDNATVTENDVKPTT